MNQHGFLTCPISARLHGGAFIAGNNDTEELINRQLAHVAGVVVFSLDYRLAPEHDVVDVIFKDAEDGFKWVMHAVSVDCVWLSV
jgi:acetyl esterase